MAIGFPARVETEVETSLLPLDAEEAVEEALERLGWGFSMSGGVFYASRSISWWSWGEEVVLDCTQEGTIVIESRSSLPQVFDWGRNQKNVDEFLRALNRK